MNVSWSTGSGRRVTSVTVGVLIVGPSLRPRPRSRERPAAQLRLGTRAQPPWAREGPHVGPLQIRARRAMTRDVETPSFTFRLERVRDLRERAEEHAREELARELALRMRGEALLREASHAVDSARDTGSGIFKRFGVTGADMLAAQAT